jgi:hypothetical protein
VCKYLRVHGFSWMLLAGCDDDDDDDNNNNFRSLSHTLAPRSMNVKFEPERAHEHNRKTRDGALSLVCFVLALI